MSLVNMDSVWGIKRLWFFNKKIYLHQISLK